MNYWAPGELEAAIAALAAFLERHRMVARARADELECEIQTLPPIEYVQILPPLEYRIAHVADDEGEQDALIQAACSGTTSSANESDRT